MFGVLSGSRYLNYWPYMAWHGYSIFLVPLFSNRAPSLREHSAFLVCSTHSTPSTQSRDQNHTLDHTFHERKGQAAAAKPRSPSLDSVNQSYLIGHNGIFTIPYEMCAPTKGDRKILGTNTPLFTKDIQEIHQWLVGLNTTFICSEEGKLAVRMIYRT